MLHNIRSPVRSVMVLTLMSIDTQPGRVSCYRPMQETVHVRRQESELKPPYEMQNPLTQFPQPQFPEQTQHAPATIHALQPQADHGEQSYESFGRLKGRKALITGADSGIDRATAIAFAREGADVVLNYLPESTTCRKKSPMLPKWCS